MFYCYYYIIIIIINSTIGEGYFERYGTERAPQTGKNCAFVMHIDFISHEELTCLLQGRRNRGSKGGARRPYYVDSDRCVQ